MLPRAPLLLKEDTFTLFVYNIHLGGSTVLHFYAEYDSNISRLRVNVNENDGKHRNTLGCLDEYACNVLRLWNSRDCETV